MSSYYGTPSYGSPGYSYTSPYGTPSTPSLQFPSMPSYNPSMFGLPPISSPMMSMPGFPMMQGGPAAVNTKAVPQRPPVRLSQSQFRTWAVNNNKPHATYASYMQYLNNHAPQQGGGGAPGGGSMMINPTPQDPTGMSAMLRLYSSQMLTPQQQWTQAQQMVNNQIQQSQAGMQTQLAYQNWLSGQNAQKAAGYAQALAQATAPDSQQILDAYRGAAGALGAFGTGLTGAVQAAQQGAASQAQEQLAGFGLKPSGGPTGQTAGMVGSYDPNDIRNAAQMMGVTIPASTLAGEGANAMAQAQFGRAAAVNNVGQIAQQYLMQNAQTQAQMMAQEMGLEAQRPSLMSQAYMSAREASRQDMAALAQAIGMQGMYQMNMGRGAYYSGRNQTQQQIATANAVAAAARAAGTNATRVQIAKLQAGSSLSTAQIAANAKLQAAAKAAAVRVSAGSATPKDRSTIITAANKDAGAFVKNMVLRVQQEIPQLAKQAAGEKTSDYNKRYNQGVQYYRYWLNVRRPQAVQGVVSLMTPRLTTLNYTPAQITAMANSVVNAYMPTPKTRR